MTDKTLSLQKPTKPSNEVAIERGITELESIDKVLIDRLSGDYNAYRDLLTDTTVTGCWAQRQTALTRLERQVLPHDPDNPADVEAAEFIEQQLSRINFDQIIKAMHWGVFYGFAVGEAMFDVADGRVVLNDVIVRNRAHFKYDKDKQLILTVNNEDEVMPAQKFWTFNAGGDTTDNPYGLGLAHYLYWPVLFKKANIKFWLLGNEKMATSVPVVTYDPRSPTPEQDRQKSLEAGIGAKNGAALAIAQGMTVELLKGESGSADYHTLCRYMDEAIALVTLGQVMTSQAVGGQYKAEVQNEVKDAVIKADADLLCASFNNSVVKWLTAWNFPNANPPKVWLITQDETDSQAVSATFANMARLGYRPTLDHVKEMLGGEWEEIPAISTQVATGSHENRESDLSWGSATEADTNPQRIEADQSSDFAEAGEPDTNTPDKLATQLEQKIAPHEQKWLDAIAAELSQSETLLQFRERLDGLASQLTLDEYAEVFAKATTAARLAGRHEAQEEAQ